MPRLRWLALLLTAAAMLGGASVAHAAAPAWLPAQRIEPAEAAIQGVSCPSQTTCLAAAESTPVVQDDGPSYEPATDVDPDAILNAVSCAPGTDFCMFVDDDGGAFTYEGGNFGDVANIDGTTGLESVSCTSSAFCMAIDHDHKVFKYSSGSWNGGTTLTVPGTYTNITKVSCVSSSFCVAIASTEEGQHSYTWNGTTWSSASSAFDPDGGYAVSLTCTSATFCLLTDEVGYGMVFSGTTWSAATHIDSDVSFPVLYSSCGGSGCVAVDYYGDAFASSNGTTWAPNNPANIDDDTGISAIGALSCAPTGTICVAGDGLGDATTYALPPNAGKPALAGSPTVGSTLGLTHAANDAPQAWYYDAWRRCDSPHSACTLHPISTSPDSYTLQQNDRGEFIDVLELVGFGFDEEGQFQSNAIGPIAGAPNTKITKASISSAKHKATLSFKAVGQASGFECELAKGKRAGFSSCTSPKTYKHLKKGRYTFEVRGKGPGGTDPSPAKKSFSIS
jgi:hypothetical protein